MTRLFFIVSRATEIDVIGVSHSLLLCQQLRLSILKPKVNSLAFIKGSFKMIEKGDFLKHFQTLCIFFTQVTFLKAFTSLYLDA